MDLHIQYLTDENGAKTAVQIPYKEWLEFYDRYRHLRQYSKLKKDLRDAFDEIKNIETGSIKKITLEEFLNDENYQSDR